MSFMSEFKEFAAKGNVMDLAVGVIIGAAFGKIVASAVGDIAMPIVGVLIGGVDFTGLALAFGKAKVLYGKFLQSCFDFVIVASAIFVAVAQVIFFINIFYSSHQAIMTLNIEPAEVRTGG